MRQVFHLAVVTAIAVSSVGACAPATPTAVPAAPTKVASPAAAATAAPATIAQPTVAAAIPTPAVKIKRGGVIVDAAPKDIPSMDPLFDTGGTTLKELGLYEALLRRDVVDFKDGKSEFRPELAESWQQVDPKTITFKLRKGVKFHDGSEFNAEVAKWNLDRMANHPKSLSKQYGDNLASIEVVDPYTLKINYKAPSALQLFNLTPSTGGTGSVGMMMLSKAHMDKVGEAAFASNPSGTGPMKFKQWLRNSEFTMTKFDGYWKDGADGQKLPYLDGLRMRFIPDGAVMLTELKAGTLHVTRELSAGDLPALKGNQEIEITMLKWAPGRQYFAFNPNKEPFGKNVKLRQAAQYALDRENMARVLGLDAGRPSYWLGWIPGWSGYDEKLPRYEYNVEKAKALVVEAGYPDGVDVALMHNSASSDKRRVEMIQAMWAKAGIRATLELMENVAARQRASAGNFEVYDKGLTASPDPGYYNRFFTCDGSANWTGYCNKEVDKCFADAGAEMDSAKRHETYKRCITIMQEDANKAGTINIDTVLVHRKEVKNIRMQGFSQDLGEAWLDK